MNKQQLQEKFDILRVQLQQSEQTGQPIQLPPGFELMTLAEINRWIAAQHKGEHCGSKDPQLPASSCWLNSAQPLQVCNRVVKIQNLNTTT